MHDSLTTFYQPPVNLSVKIQFYGIFLFTNILDMLHWWPSIISWRIYPFFNVWHIKLIKVQNYKYHGCCLR